MGFGLSCHRGSMPAEAVGITRLLPSESIRSRGPSRRETSCIDSSASVPLITNTGRYDECLSTVPSTSCRIAACLLLLLLRPALAPQTDGRQGRIPKRDWTLWELGSTDLSPHTQYPVPPGPLEARSVPTRYMAMIAMTAYPTERKKSSPPYTPSAFKSLLSFSPCSHSYYPPERLTRAII